MFLKEEFDQINSDFRAALKIQQSSVYNSDLNYAILGSPLMTSNILILSTNWAGPIDKPSDQIMPDTNELLAFPNEVNNRNLLNFFDLALGHREKTSLLLSKSIYTNACFIRTPNTKGVNYSILKLGFELSLPFLLRMIDLISPKLILCFGNSKNDNLTPTHSISKLIGKELWWEDESKEKITPRSTSYNFTGTINNKMITVYSFPHANNFSRWNSNEWSLFKSKNKSFQTLREDLKKILEDLPNNSNQLQCTFPLQ